MLSYLWNIIKYKKWKCLLFIIFVVLGLQGFLLLRNLRPSVHNLLELEKCPACYGISACSFIQEIDITPQNIFSLFTYLIGVKNVFFGVHNGRKVVLKKLAHDSELEEFDRTICSNDYFANFCVQNVNKNIAHTTDYYKFIEETVSLNYTSDDRSRLRLCPKTMHLQDLLHNVYIYNKNVDKEFIDANIWTLVSINPEPLILQILPSHEGWPVPKYFGACGRIVIEEYVGLSIVNYYQKPWLRRARIVSNLLDAINMFTFRSERFGFYLTDISVDNIAIDTQDKPKFIDLENVIVVDKKSLARENHEKHQGLQENVSDFDCINCLIFSPIDICNHKVSDHNYYGICQVLLNPKTCDNSIPDGFLHDIPTDILHRYPLLTHLIERCSFPTLLENRIHSGQQLKKLLDVIVEEGIHNL